MQQFQEILIIGMGLIGGSLSLALKKSGYQGKIIGCDLSKEALIEAKAMGAIDVACEVPQEAVKNADLIVIAVPVGYYDEVFKEIAAYLPKGVVITDVGSIKGYVETAVARHLPKDIQFLGGHPMAGSEKGGIKAATPFLYENAYYFLTPNGNTRRDTIEKLESLVKGIGAYPVIVEAREHDKIVAQISHIPHLAAVLLASLLEKRNSTSYIPFVGGGFRDTTRIAAGNPNMWKDIFFLNKGEVLEGIKTLEGLLQDFKSKLLEGKQEEVLEALEKAKSIRDGIPHTARDYIPPLYDLIIDVQDRPGVLGELTQVIGTNHINIKEIEILHAREGELGAVRIGFSSKDEQEKALMILKKGSFPLTYRKGENEDVCNPQNS
ncbi:prephenate dehydrogenase [Anaerovirgula multivorans]|uniref:Prephenate dehydrogenase n=1 Tax=Anaerovirgula multivorans TaxID=312168 RepID=A0A239HKV0_9FIRM|nr:prephenate dehydrogenase [Anaerovirgula multivorans]SNS81463.1 prephenate dehydrogenase [Anaerovirgula multivorans]